MNEDFHFEPLGDNLATEQIVIIENQIFNSMPFLEKNLGRIITYLKKENEFKNRVEIDLPFLGSNISFRVFLNNNKIVILVMNVKDSRMFGYLILKGSDFMDKENVKKFKTKIRMKGNNL